MLSYGKSSSALSLAERIFQPTVYSGMAYVTKARHNDALDTGQSHTESIIMFRKYFINLCSVGDVNMCLSNWSQDVMTLYVTKDNRVLVSPMYSNYWAHFHSESEEELSSFFFTF